MKALDTGLLDFEIEFKNGDKGILSFNPNDIMFYDELAKLESKMKEIYSEYENFTTVNENNVAEITSKMRNETCEKIKNEFDSLFGVGASAVIFKYSSPISFVRETYYPYYFLNEFLPDVAKVMSKTNAKAAENAKKMFAHTAKYANRK